MQETEIKEQPVEETLNSETNEFLMSETVHGVFISRSKKSRESSSLIFAKKYIRIIRISPSDRSFRLIFQVLLCLR